MAADGNVEMLVSVLPGTFTGFAALNAGLASINNSFLNMTQAISDNFGLVQTAVVTLGAVVLQVGANAATAFGDFEQSMKIVQMVSQQTSDDIAILGQRANEFAVQYRMDIDNITEGLQTLGRAGLNSASEQSEVLQNGLNTAKLEGRELNAVLQELIQNTALLGGDLKSENFGEQSAYVNDLLVATSLSAPITTHDISETLKYSGGIAAAAGANIETEAGQRILEDYMGTIAAFAQKGVTGSIAGTALRAFLNKPATQDSSVLEGLATIKLKPESLWEDSGDMMKPISEQIHIIQKQMDKLNISTMDRLQIWSKIVGGKMGQQMMKLDSEDISNLTKDIQDSQTAESLAQRSMQTFKANVNELEQKGQRLFREFGERIVETINPILDIINKVTEFFNNPLTSYALFGGLLLFLARLKSAVGQVIGGLRQGLGSVWKDYKDGNILTIRDYLRKNRGGTNTGEEPQSRQQFMKGWKQPSQDPYLVKYKEGKITADQLGTYYHTIRWDSKKLDIFHQDDKDKVSNHQVIKELAFNNRLRPEHYTALRSGMTQAAFLKEFETELKILYTILKTDTQATEENVNAQRKHTAEMRKRHVQDYKVGTVPNKLKSAQEETSSTPPKTQPSKYQPSKRVDYGELNKLQKDAERFRTDAKNYVNDYQRQVQRDYIIARNQRNYNNSLFGSRITPGDAAVLTADIKNKQAEQNLILTEMSRRVKDYRIGTVPYKLTSAQEDEAARRVKDYRIGTVPNRLTSPQEDERARRLQDYNYRMGAVPYRSGTATQGTFMRNLTNWLTRSREGRGIAFTNKGLGKLGNMALNATDAIGGVTMASMMLAQIIVGVVQKAFEDFCKKLKEAEQAVDDAYKKYEQANNDIEETYKENNPGATQEDLDSFMYDIYNQMEQDMQDNRGAYVEKASQGMSYPEYEYDKEADDGSMKEKEKPELGYEEAIKENTAALYSATAQLRMATDQFVSKMNDGLWGIDGFASKFSDNMGAFADTWGGWTQGTQFSDEGTFLKTASQKDDNYAGYTELAGLMLEDLHDSGNDWQGAFRTLLGSQYGNDVINTMGKSAQATMKSFGRFSESLSRADNSRLQSSMKRNTKDWQALAKEVTKYQRKTGKLPGKEKTDNKRLERLISKLATETGLSRIQILQAQSLQAMQDMYSIAQSAIVPTISTEAEIAAGHYQLATKGIDPSSRQAAYGAQDTADIAAVIASMVSMIAQTKAVEAAWQQGILAGDPDAIAASSAEDYLKKGVGVQLQLGTTFHKPAGMNDSDWSWSQFGLKDGQFVGLKTRVGGNDKILDNIYTTFEMMGTMRRNPQWSEDQAFDYSKKKLEPYKDGDRYLYNPDVMLKMLRENYGDAVAPSILAAYEASDIGEPEGSSGGGSGGGGDSKDDKDDDKKTKKERVDLVLCNKKEIPKLNVNLFKKAPSFTILNKNFKLRDIKVNTQDKPKAVLASIKNAIIDVQKRSDPKIIQDESAEYDPVAATDGNSVPSGSTNTSTD